MPQPRASRLNHHSSKAGGLLSAQLPYGSWRRRIVLGILIPLFCAVVVWLVIDNLVMPTITRHNTEFPLPDCVGQRTIEAAFTLEELGLKHEVASQEYSPGKAQGIILAQFPVSGTKVKEGRTVKFIVSMGQKLVFIPETAGKSVRQAILDLETAGLVLGEIAWAFSDTLPERVVVFSYPAAASEIPLGSAVNLMVNHGRASTFTYMPGICGVTLDEAQKRLADKDLKVGVITYRTDENYLPETVLEQSEPEGSELDIGTEIDLVVSSTG